ncbi:Rv3654c family TadE-like protein [Kineosporia rhizophila]|uniref:Rv3654c family TadE-like protein n=1 Tax=Kineosporia rhizophila TaxID=84633 RepID=UPI0022B7E7A1|nr:Rv3654c family TadE-like protein [Kineosporia rhizophila]
MSTLPTPLQWAGHPGVGPRRGACPVRDRGSGTVLMLGLVGVAVVLAVTTLGVGAALAARHRAAAAADLAALAAIDSGRHCSGAAQIAAINGARLASCEFAADGSVAESVLVEVPGLAVDVFSEARAGPGPAQIPGAGALPGRRT